MSNTETRNQYLKAMGIDVWVSRENTAMVVPEASQNNENKTPVESVNQVETDKVVNNSRILSATDCKSTNSDVSTLDWQQLKAIVNSCQCCELLKTRKNNVFGSGNTQADLFIIGSIPNPDEDNLSKEFIGLEGVLLDNMLRAINVLRSDVYTSNLIKCNPQHSRQFGNTEMENCAEYIHRQISLVVPKGIIIFGEQTAQFILKTNKSMAALTTQMHDYEYSDALIVVIEHPEQLLVSTAGKKQAWLNLKQIKTILNK